MLELGPISAGFAVATLSAVILALVSKRGSLISAASLLVIMWLLSAPIFQRQAFLGTAESLIAIDVVGLLAGILLVQVRGRMWSYFYAGAFGAQVIIHFCLIFEVVGSYRYFFILNVLCGVQILSVLCGSTKAILQDAGLLKPPRRTTWR